MELRLATFNLENLGIRAGEDNPRARARLPLHMEALRQVIHDLDADAVAFQECLDPALLDPLLAGLGYPHRVVSTAGSSVLRAGVFSRHPLGPGVAVAGDAECTAVDPETGLEVRVAGIFSRPALRVSWHPPGLHITLFVVHGKSKIPSFTTARPSRDAGPWPSLGEVAEGRLLTEVKRLSQAVVLRREVDAVLKTDPDAAVVVLGDFNDVLESEAVRCLLGDAGSVGSTHLADGELYPCELELPPEKRYSQIYRGRLEMIDHILVSRSLQKRLGRVVVNNEGLRDSGATAPGEGQFVGSDHAPLMVAFYSSAAHNSG